MKLNLGIQPHDLAKEPIAGPTLGQIIANQLAMDAKGDPLKYFEWAMALNSKGMIDLDSSDQTTFENFVKGCDKLTNLVKAQILTAIRDAKDKK